MGQDAVRFGLIGYGAWGGCHASAITKCESAQLTSICAKSDATAEAARAAYPDANVYQDYGKMLAEESLDVVDIVLPSHLHFGVAHAVLQTKCNLLLEKPMTFCAADCQKLNALAADYGVWIAIGHELRLSSLWGKVRSLIEEGQVGEPKYVLVELARKPYRQGAEGWRYDIGRVGNWILEEPIHFFDLARWYLSDAGDPDSIFATANSIQPGHPELQDNFSAIMRYANGAYAVVTQTLAAFEHHQTVKVAGTEGAIWARWSGAMDRVRKAQMALRVSHGDEVMDVPVETMAGELFELESEIERVAEAARGAPLSCATGDDGMWSVAMCEAAVASAKVGQPISMNEVFG